MPDDDEAAPEYLGLTGNQLVAYNLRRARQLRGWTQEEAAEELEPYLGSRWSKATFSAAERSVDRDRARHFTADDLLAFAQGFDVPISWFFLPPAADFGWYDAIEGTEPSRGLSFGGVLEAVLGTEEGRRAYHDELKRRQAQAPGQGGGGLPLVLLEGYESALAGGVIKQNLAYIPEWRRNLADLAKFLRETERLAEAIAGQAAQPQTEGEGPNEPQP